MSSPILDQLNKLREFEIEVDIPLGFTLPGVVPFDASISENRGKFKVFAVSFSAAEQKIKDYITKNTV